VGAVYRRNKTGTGADQLFIIRGSNQTRQPSSEFLYYRVDTQVSHCCNQRRVNAITCIDAI
jgi:hypothetical protein